MWVFECSLWTILIELWTCSMKSFPSLHQPNRSWAAQMKKRRYYTSMQFIIIVIIAGFIIFETSVYKLCLKNSVEWIQPFGSSLLFDFWGRTVRYQLQVNVYLCHVWLFPYTLSQILHMVCCWYQRSNKVYLISYLKCDHMFDLKSKTTTHTSLS